MSAIFDVERADREETERAPRRLVVLALATGLALDVGLRGGVSNVLVAIGLAAIPAILLGDRRIERKEARVLAAAALVPAAFLALRASPWLAWSNVAAWWTLTITAVLYSRTGSVLDATPARILQRGAGALRRSPEGLRVTRTLAPDLRPGQASRLGQVTRAAVVALPMLLAVVLLLASADAVFAALLTPDVDLVPVSGHAVLTVLVAVAIVCIATAATATADDWPRTATFGVVEVVTMLALAAAVLGLFVVSQLFALTGAGRRLVESSGLTPAEYARSGFFQLCWATGLVLAFLGVVRSLATADAAQHRAVRLLGAAVPLLALGLVIVSLRRMALYDDAFGLTMLRLWVVGAATWMALVLVMTAARSLGFHADRHWLAAGSGATALALVLIADVANPEAFVVRHNVSRARAGAELDVDYLRNLSDDALPAIVAAVDATDDERLAIAVHCSRREGGVTTLNLAVARAAALRDDRCP